MKSKRQQQRDLNQKIRKNARENVISSRQPKAPEHPPIDVDTLDWEACCGAMLVAIGRHSPKEAHAALDRFLVGNQVREAITIDSPVSLLEFVGESSLGVREINALESNGFATVRAFLAATDQDLLLIRNFSIGTLDRCRRLKDQLRIDLGLARRPVSAIERILRG